MSKLLPELYIDLMINYHKTRTSKSFSGEELVADIVEKKIPYTITQLINTSSNKYNNWKVIGSVGKGQWATIPWVAILNPNVTNTVSEGVYVVYLFSSKGERVYLTLNQGTGGINRAQIGPGQKQVIEKYKKRITELNNFNYGPLKQNALDGDGNQRSKAYESACILWKEYSLDDLNKRNQDTMIKDLLELFEIYNNIENNEVNNYYKRSIYNTFTLKELLEKIYEAGLIFPNKLIVRLVSSLLTKPFVILSGLSGSGKTKLAQAFALWICQDHSQYCIVPVGADWTNREPLLGYPNALKPDEYIRPDNGALDIIINANNNPELPYFLILDEMNLSHVERYFADFLSVMESKGPISLYAEGTVNNGVPPKLPLPPNLFIIGTVNIDETTYMFSPKVLDRANTIEFRVNADELQTFLANRKEVDMNKLQSQGASMAQSFLTMASQREFDGRADTSTHEMLISFFEQLKKTGAEFGYRSAAEIVRLINQLTIVDPGLSEDEKLDIAIMQKLLPKLHGSRRKLCPVLVTLAGFCVDKDKIQNIEKNIFAKDDFDFTNNGVIYPISLEKIARMHKGAIENGFTSYAEA